MTSITISHNTVLIHVINGIKAGVPIYKTLKKYKWSSAAFYKLCDDETKRYFRELKCLKIIDGTNHRYRKKDYFGDYTTIE